MKKDTQYTTHITWEEAVANTDSELFPFAAKLVRVSDTPDITADFALGENHFPYVLVSMTTRFLNPAHDNKLGWFPLESEIKQDLSKLLYDNNVVEEWVYFSVSKTIKQLRLRR